MFAFFLGLAFGAAITATVWYAWRKWQAYQLDRLCMTEDEFCAGLYRMDGNRKATDFSDARNA